MVVTPAYNKKQYEYAGVGLIKAANIFP